MTHKFKTCPWGSLPDKSERAERETVANKPRYVRYKLRERRIKEKREEMRKRERNKPRKGDDVLTIRRLPN